jgi:hypothetical protein
MSLGIFAIVPAARRLANVRPLAPVEPRRLGLIFLGNLPKFSSYCLVCR